MVVKKEVKSQKPQKQKVYVFDTSALLQDPSSITQYSKCIVVLPVTVLAELDKHKTRMDAVGRNARQIPRILKKYKEKGSLVSGIKIPEQEVTIEFYKEDLANFPEFLDKDKPDDRILSTCLAYKERPNSAVHLVTNDMYLSLKAEVYGISTFEVVESNLLNVFEYKGHRCLQETKSLCIDTIYKEGQIVAPKNYKFCENEFCLIQNKAKSKQSVRCRYKNGILHLVDPKIACSKLRPLNNEQAYIMDLLLDPSISLVTITGSSGTGKTLSAVACGLEQVIGKDPMYKKLVISRSLELLSGRDKLGYLKGGLEEKLAPFILPLRDAVDFILGEDRHGFEYLQKDAKKLEIEPLQYIRGRSITNTFFIVDEVQNLSRSDVKTIITRIGDGSKIVLLGDLDQIDNSYLTRSTNGLAQVVERFKNSPLSGHIELDHGVRSPLATEAASLL
jgi:PhoH-like ATPase